MNENSEHDIKPVVGVDGYFITKDGIMLSKKVGGRLKPLKTYVKIGGYLEVKLRKDGGYVHAPIHKAVLEAFVCRKPPNLEARHLDGNPQNNRVENLKWGTRQENNNDQVLHGTAYVAKGVLHGKATVSESDVLEIRAADLKIIGTARAFSERFGVSVTQIFRIKNKTCWSHI